MRDVPVSTIVNASLLGVALIGGVVLIAMGKDASAIFTFAAGLLVPGSPVERAMNPKPEQVQ